MNFSRRRPSASGAGSASGSTAHIESYDPKSTSPKAQRSGQSLGSFSSNGFHRPERPSHLNPAISGVLEEDISPPGLSPSKAGSVGVGRSGLTVMMEREHERRRQATLDEARDVFQDDDAARTPMAPPAKLARTDSDLTDSQKSGDVTPKAHRASIAAETVMEPRLSDTTSETSDPNNSSALRRYLEGGVDEEAGAAVDERSALLGREGLRRRRPGVFSQLGEKVKDVKQRATKVTPGDVVDACIKAPIATLPSVILGCLLNVLDGVSYGMIL